MFVLSFFALLRVVECTVSNMANHTIPVTYITITSEQGHPTQVSLTLKNYKHFVAPVTITITSLSRVTICPVRAIHAFKQIRPASKGPFFVSKSGSPVTTKQFNLILKKSIGAKHLKPNSYTSHSFRIGGATLADMNNFTDS